MIDKKNIFFIPEKEANSDEYLKVLSEKDGVQIEKIVSYGIPSPEGFWYDEEFSEWVSVIKGNASIEYENGTIIDINHGDHIIIAPHEKHRVSNVSNPCIWIAVKF